MQVPNASKLLDIKGVGLSTAATFVGEVGDISRFPRSTSDPETSRL